MAVYTMAARCCGEKMNSVSAKTTTGYKITPLLWKAFASRLSTGRVQSAVLNMMCMRDDQIDAHEPSPYWVFDGAFQLDGVGAIDAKLYATASDTLFRATDPAGAKDALGACKGGDYAVHVGDVKKTKEAAPRPFTTSTLQQEAHARHGFSLKTTMALAQHLYEQGKITYMRTDSTSMSKAAVQDAHSVIRDTYGEEYVAQVPTASGKQSKNAQEAHECIRPTGFSTATLEVAEGGLTRQHCQLYALIWKRAVASCMPAAEREEQWIAFDNAELGARGHCFRTRAKQVTFDGFIRAYGSEAQGGLRPGLVDKSQKAVCQTVTAKNGWTSPPGRYTEASLVKVMESDGIGRPSTYAATIGRLMENGLIDKSTSAGTHKSASDFVLDGARSTITKASRPVLIGMEQGRLRPTAIGHDVNGFMTTNFPHIADAGFTSNMEEMLDGIAKGKMAYFDVVKAFYDELQGYIARYVPFASNAAAAAAIQHDIDGRVYSVQQSKYGPVIKHGDPKPAYINLSKFMSMYGKSTLQQVSEADVAFLASLPSPMAHAPGYMLHYGMHGFYVKSPEGRTMTVAPTLLAAEPIGLLDLTLAALERENHLNKKPPRKKRATK